MAPRRSAKARRQHKISSRLHISQPVEGPTVPQQAHPAPTFSLLADLPREIRDNIYEYCAADITRVRIPSRPAKFVGSEHPLHRVSKKVAKEFNTRLRRVAQDQATIIKAGILDFNFKPLQDFFKRKTGSLHIDKDGRGDVEIKIELSFSRGWVRNPDPEGLLAWFEWIEKKVEVDCWTIPRKRLEYPIVDMEGGGLDADALMRFRIHFTGNKWWDKVEESLIRYSRWGSTDKKVCQTMILREAADVNRRLQGF